MSYRGKDNPKARRPVSRAGGVMHSVPRMHVPPEYRPALLPGRKSRRERVNVWLPGERAA